jgi:hypothetical protein
MRRPEIRVSVPTTVPLGRHDGKGRTTLSASSPDASIPFGLACSSPRTPSSLSPLKENHCQRDHSTYKASSNYGSYVTWESGARAAKSWQLHAQYCLARP